jgi:hypothetical protein
LSGAGVSLAKFANSVQTIWVGHSCPAFYFADN